MAMSHAEAGRLGGLKQKGGGAFRRGKPLSSQRYWDKAESHSLRKDLKKGGLKRETRKSITTQLRNLTKKLTTNQLKGRMRRRLNKRATQAAKSNFREKGYIKNY